MLATTGELPTGKGWAYELKWDGVRALVEVTEGRVSITSRNGNDVTRAYPELQGLAGVLEDAVLDGEIVAIVAGRPSFGALQNRMHVRDAASARALARTTPVTLFVFDILRLYGVDLTARPFAERRATLERLSLGGESWCVPPVFDDGPATDAAAREQGLEGVIAKRLDAPYRPGGRTGEWVKVKYLRRQEFVVAGIKPGEGGRAGRIGSLLLGAYDDAGVLRFVGHVGTGFTAAELSDLGRRLAPLARPTSPYGEPVAREHARGAQWVEPQLVVEVAYGAWTTDGRLRHPSYQGLRKDKDPREVTYDR